MKRTLLLLLPLLLASTAVYSQVQSLQGFIRAAEKAADREDYYSAYNYYQIALEYDSSRIDLWYELGESARLWGAYNLAESAYREVMRRPGRDTFAVLDYRYAQVNMRNGDYDEAAAYYQQFLESEPGGPEDLRRQAQIQLTDIEWAMEQLQQADSIRIYHLGDTINTAYSDFGYTRRGDTVYYSSFRFDYKEDTLNPRRNLIRILRSIGDAEPEPLPKNINREGMHAAHTALTADGRRVYFNLCVYESGDLNDIRCDLYTTTIDEKGKWGDPSKLDLNQDFYTHTQPNVGYDELEEREYLFFASDRPGGQGGLDLYRAPINADGSVGTPENLAYLNTAYDEATPFYYAPSRTLFFSTNGRFSFGGLDLYRSAWDGEGFSDPVNLGSPVNSSYDEVYYAQFPDTLLAYYSTNRPDSAAIFWDDERNACCFDIYKYTPDDRIRLLALTYNGLTNKELMGATVRLLEIMPDGREIERESKVNTLGNDFNFMLDPGRKYKVVASKPSFGEAVALIDLKDPRFAGKRDIEQKLYLSQGVVLEVFTFRQIDSTALPGATVYLFEKGPDGEEILVDSLVNDGGNDFRFQLDIGKEYTVRARRDGYGPAMTTVDTRNYDPGRDGGKISRNLYLGQQLDVFTFDSRTRQPLPGVEVLLLSPDGRDTLARTTNPLDNDFHFFVNLDQPYRLVAKRQGYRTRDETLTFTPADVVAGGGKLTFDVYLDPLDPDEFLPIRLYFDNDRPNPRSRAVTTQADYEEAYREYLERKDEFIREYTSGMSPEDAFVTEGRFRDFFSLSLEKGWSDLQLFTDRLLAYLEQGNRYTLNLKGYSSPRAGTEYNRRLSARRVDAVRNYFERYADGALQPFLRSGQLTIREQALGESTADLNQISDRLDDPRESIFSVVASLERRVEIQAVSGDDQ